MLFRTLRAAAGFSAPEILVVLSLIGIVSAIAVPSLTNAIDSMKLGQAVREVERELQTAKSRAVGKGRPIRVRFNCPAAGQYRVVELIGTPAAPAAADLAADRCSELTYPYPAADNNPVTRPNLDGPVRRLESSVTFTAMPTIEFWSDGTAHYDAGTGNPWPLIPVAGINVSVTRKGVTSTITVNGLGKVLLQTY
jgi:prepilin-type N-terminal cleavage/methylation domain-containing protein